MYTLLLIVIAHGQAPVVTHFLVPRKDCDKTANLLVAQSTSTIQVQAQCIPR